MLSNNEAINLFETSLAYNVPIYEYATTNVTNANKSFFDYEKYDTGDSSWVPTGISNTSDLIDLSQVDVIYENNINAGKVTAHVKAKDTSTKYSGEIDLTYDIVCNLPSDTKAKVINDGDKKVDIDEY